MEYNSAAEYWFYRCLDSGPNWDDKQHLKDMDNKVFRECYEMYEWATLWYIESLRSGDNFIINPLEIFTLTEEYINKGVSSEISRVHNRKPRNRDVH